MLEATIATAVRIEERHWGGSTTIEDIGKLDFGTGNVVAPRKNSCAFKLIK